jgi:hypothetical protein
MGKVPMERGDGIKSPRLFFLDGPFFPLDMTGGEKYGEKIYRGGSRVSQQYILETQLVIRGWGDQKRTP